MRILVFSDSHGRRHRPEMVVAAVAKSIDMILHTGDGPEDVEPIAEKYGIPFRFVHGNCDHGNIREELFEAESRRIRMVHGNMAYVKSNYDTLIAETEAARADICLFGHSHVPAIFRRGETLYMNPGSISMPRLGQCASYGILNLLPGASPEAAIMLISQEGIRPADPSEYDSI
jgi:putative phosphoesterase